MHIIKTGRALQSASRLSRVPRDQVLVVSVQLRHGFLKDDTPHRLVISDVPEESLVRKGAISLPQLLKWQIIVYDDGVRDAESVQVDGVDSVLVSLAVRVEEDFLEALGSLGQRTSSDHKPAVAHSSLPHIQRCNSIISPERVVGELVDGPMPLNSIDKLRNLTRFLRVIVGPKQRVFFDEHFIREHLRPTVKFRQRLHAHLMCGRAGMLHVNLAHRYLSQIGHVLCLILFRAIKCKVLCADLRK